MARPSWVLICLLLVAVIGELCLGDKAVDKCIKGPLHKDKPSPEGPGYVECTPWKDNACCTANFTAELKRNNVEVLYNFSWNHCANLSQACERFIKNEECFWQCEPNLINWHTTGGALEGVPICAKYCDDWFDACKNDFTCAQDWLSGFNYSSSVYSCPTKSTCFKFSEVYSNGKGLCDTMWGKSFTYEKGDNCMSMWFTGKNPNEDVTRNPTSAATCYSKFIYPAMILSLINLLLNSY
ncbi:Folate receptor [Desmophyllum pertusum]|uniref:Folate receptor n=1 Tax=Desmophyllum pertusum TaxID=174260 RepID=A0A9W9Y9C3_9CNID|nr:Folate receptor [Desmophyllum pertusum]